MIAEVAALIDGHRTVLDIIQALDKRVSSEEVFHTFYLLSDWGRIVAGDMAPRSVVKWRRPETAASFKALFKACGSSLRSLVSISPDDDFPLHCYAAFAKQSGHGTGESESGSYATGLAKPGRITLGSGFTREEGMLAALGERAETVALSWSGGITISRSTVKEEGKKGLHPDQLQLVSDRQYRMRPYWRRRYGERHRIPIAVENTTPLDWVSASVYPDGTSCLVPAGYCFLDYPHDHDYLVADSNGCAAAQTRMEAMVSGFLELVERDAVAIWWYNRIRRPAIDPAAFNSPELNECTRWMDQTHRRFYILDLTHDYGIPVVAAISVNNEDTDMAMGFGADIDCLAAVKSAVCEMMQVYSLKKVMERQIRSGGINSLDRSARVFISWANSEIHTHMRPHGIIRSLKAPGPAAGSMTPDAAWQFCIALCREKNQRLFVLDLTPPTADIPVVRVIAPGMRHFRPRFSPGRLYQVPVTMGWRMAPLNERDLTRIPVPI